MASQFIAIEPFTPAWKISNPHAQTVLANVVRPTAGVHFRRERLNTPDGDFVDLDYAYVRRYHWLWTPLGNSTPIVLAVHGLEGSARRGYMCEIYRQLAYRGIRAVGLNFRSCSGEMNRTPRMYHSGATYDVELALNRLAEQFPDVPIGLVGFSLGANVTLKYMGEGGKGVKTAVSISPPFDLAAGSRVLAQGTSRIYTRHLLHSLKQKAKAKAAQLQPYIDVEAALNAQTFNEFDNAWAPLHGFKDAADYYRQCSSRNFLVDINKPTLILRALDDPFFSPADVPHDLIAENRYIQAAFPQHGGHVAFVEGTMPGKYRYWAERQGAQFLASIFAQQPG
ncbi:MAG: alpha/beta fold hydrolase [Anaerolineales bacterium]|nr:alpha/beta fold hydrolase [Anaerolineales bacterium]